MNIDFKSRTVNGKPFTCDPQKVTLQECLSEIERLYQIYKYSTPTENDKRRTYFYALPAEKLTDAELVLGVNRHEAKVALEMYVLTMIVGGVLRWDENVMKGKWFWKGNDGDLIILREWVD